MTVEDTQVTGIVFSKDARKKLYNGLRLAAEAVSCTLGPNGKTVLIQNGDNSPIITKDGVTVSKSVRLPDPLEMMGAQLLREAASQTNDVAGDGTTTSTVLTHALVKEGMKLLDAGYNSKKLCNGVDIAAKTITQFITMMSHSVESSEKICQIGTISANGDAKIGEGTNIGAATVFVNYDGVEKHETIVGDHVRIGSDSMLVAPVTIGDGAYTAAGSVITEDVPPGAIGVARAKQRNVLGWVLRKRSGTKSADAASRHDEKKG